jgi:uncharacterized protein YgiM (DUF1202 family)
MPAHKQIFFAFLLGCTALACTNERPATPDTADELERKRLELEKKRQELQDKQQIAEIEAEMEKLDAELDKVERPAEGSRSPGTTAPAPAKSPAPAGPAGRITTGNVVMRSSSSVKSNKIGNFNAGETVTVLEKQEVENAGEAILTREISLFASNAYTGQAQMKLSKGKAVLIEDYNEDTNKYDVTYQDPKKGKLYAAIDADALETISGATWYRVRRSNGQTGWVLGKFLETKD